MYRYLISYAHSTGYGTLEIARTIPIRSTADLTDTLNHLRSHGGVTNPFILGFSLFADPAPTSRAAS